MLIDAYLTSAHPQLRTVRFIAVPWVKVLQVIPITVRDICSSMNVCALFCIIYFLTLLLIIIIIFVFHSLQIIW